MPRLSPHSELNNLQNRNRKVRSVLWSWHRRIGLVAALFVLILAVTGIFLNHTDSLSLSSIRLPHSLRAFFYRTPDIPIQSVYVDSHWLSQAGNTGLFVADQPLTECDGKLKGALQFDGYYLVACQRELQLFTQQWELIEGAGRVQQLPEIADIGTCDGVVCFRSIGSGSDDTLYRLDLNEFSWTPVGSSENYSPAEMSNTTNEFAGAVARQYIGDSVSVERWLLDLHSGRLFGRWGVLWVDLMAILFVLSATTGIVAWYIGIRKSKR